MPTALPTTETITLPTPTGPDTTLRVSVDPRREVIAGGAWLWQAPVVAALPRWIDDLTRDFGGTLYTQMTWDPAVQSATRLLRESAVSAAPVIPPTVEGVTVSDGHPEYAQAAKVADLCSYALAHLQPDLRAFLFELSEAILHGHALAEIVWALRTRDAAIGPQWHPHRVKVRHPDRYTFVQDPYGNQLGVQYAAPGQPLITTPMVTPGVDGTIPHFLPRSQYLLYTHWPQYGDPRGRSILRAAYHAWFFKRQVALEYLRYVATYAMPLLMFELWPDARPDPTTGDAPEVAAGAKVATLRNGGYMVVPNGSKLTAIQAQGEGRTFLSAQDYANHEITTAILMATRATMEAEHGSRADSGTAQDVVELGVARLRSDLAGVLVADLLTPLIIYNYGEAALRYRPLLTLGTSERHDFATEATAMASLAGTEIIHSSMLPGIRGMLNLPQADAALEAADRAQKTALTVQLAQAKAAAPAIPPPGADPTAPPADPTKEAPPHA